MNKSLIDHVCVINLDSRPDRWLEMQYQLASLGIRDAHRFSAVSFDELKCDPPENFRDYAMAALTRKKEDRNAEHQIKAMWGCLSSHVGVIEHAKSMSWPYVLILEDDCEFEPYAKGIINSLTTQADNLDWDMLYLGGSLKGKQKKQKVSANLLKVKAVNLAHAYLVHFRVFNKILSDAPISGMTIDDYYRKILQREVVTFLASPIIAYQKANEVSDISQVARKRKYNLKKFGKWLYKLINRIRYAKL